MLRVALLVFVLTTVTLAAGQAPRVDLDALLDRASQQVTRFGADLQGVVAREHYVQAIRRWSGAPPAAPGQGERLASRALSSSLLLVHDPATPWQLHRDVVEVDGRPVTDRAGRLAQLFADPQADPRRRLREITDESARFNIGHVTRNINVPTFPLIVLHASHRDRFRFRDRGLVAGAMPTLRRLAYAERGRPRIVRGQYGRDVRLEGELLVEEESGALVHATLTPRGDDLQSRLEVWFERRDGLPHPVPVRMWEWYWVRGEDRDRYVDGDATYSDFRRYATSVGAPRVP